MSRTIEVSDETFEKIRDQLGENELLEIDQLDDLIGKKVFIRTVTYHLTGKIVKRLGKFWQLKDAAWIADSGNFMKAIKDGELDEVEPVGEAFVNIDSITDLFPWKHKLPKDQK